MRCGCCCCAMDGLETRSREVEVAENDAVAERVGVFDADEFAALLIGRLVEDLIRGEDGLPKPLNVNREAGVEKVSREVFVDPLVREARSMDWRQESIRSEVGWLMESWKECRLFRVATEPERLRTFLEKVDAVSQLSLFRRRCL